VSSPHSQTRLKTTLQRFRDLYGDGEVTVLRAPARINILGEHVDYVSYLPTASLPFGSHQHDMLLLFRASDDFTVRGASTNEIFAPFSFALGGESDPGFSEQNWAQQSWESFLFKRPIPPPHWSNYVKGSIYYARWKFGSALDRGVMFLIDSTIPASGGASSSSALVVLMGAAIRRANQIEYAPDELARDSSMAEWYLGTRGGALDHTAICLARSGHAVYIQHWNQQVQFIPLPDGDYRWVTFFSHKADKGSEVMLEYNERAAVSRFLIPAIRERDKRNVPETITLDQFARIYPESFTDCERAFPDLIRERRTHPLKVLDRMRHHTGEMSLVNAAISIPFEDVPADVKMRRLGDLINMSHLSLRNFYEVSTPEVEQLRDVICRDPLVYGARLMGGGFGGNILALTTVENLQTLIDRVQKDYYNPRSRNGIREGSVMVSTPGDGLSALEE
jgi:galactokinase